MTPLTSVTLIRRRAAGLPTTNVTNELADVVNRIAYKTPGTNELQLYGQPFIGKLTSPELAAGVFNAKSVIGPPHLRELATTPLTAPMIGALAEADDMIAYDLAELDGYRVMLPLGEDSITGRMVVVAISGGGGNIPDPTEQGQVLQSISSNEFRFLEPISTG